MDTRVKPAYDEIVTSIRVPVLFIHPGLVGLHRHAALEVFRNRDMTLAPWLGEVLPSSVYLR